MGECHGENPTDTQAESIYEKKKSHKKRKSEWSRAARDRSRDRATAQKQQGREGKGREGKKKGKVRGREGADLRRGKERACGEAKESHGQQCL
jgi:hypothetical protein